MHSPGLVAKKTSELWRRLAKATKTTEETLNTTTNPEGGNGDEDQRALKVLRVYSSLGTAWIRKPMTCGRYKFRARRWDDRQPSSILGRVEREKTSRMTKRRIGRRWLSITVRTRGPPPRGDATGSIADNVSAVNNVEDERSLQWVPWCWVNNQPPPAKYHPVYSAGWNDGFCELSSDCNSPGYDTQLECCNAAFANQGSGACYGGLPDPPTDSPTASPTDRPTESPTPVTGAAVPWCWVNNQPPPAKYHPVYSAGWNDGFCEFSSDCNSPGYDTQLECCKAAFANQGSGACYGGLPDPPTDSPTSSPTDSPTESPTPVPTKSPVKPAPTTGTADFWYPDYSVAWSEGGCSNALPLPYANIGDRPNYPTQLECCKAAFANQGSGACYGGLPDPPTDSPTSSPTDSPTESPTPVTGAAVPWCWVNNQPPPAKYHPVYSAGWSDGFCEFSSDCNSPGYDTQLECCNAAFANQGSGACYGGLPDPPTDSPTSSPTDSPTESPTPVPTKSPVKPAPTTGTADFWYPDYSSHFLSNGQSDGITDSRSDEKSDRPNYPTQLECCKAIFANQSHFLSNGQSDGITDSRSDEKS
ncbi:hypothetical protein ACHAW5_010895, partial [Stephanodiscus triporus]